MAVVKIPRTSGDDDQAGADTPPWEMLVPDGWHKARICEVDVGKWRPNELTLRYKIGRALQNERNMDLDEPKDLGRLRKIAKALGYTDEQIDDFDTDSLDGRELEVKIAHGKERDKPPYRWVNVVGYRALGAAPGMGGPVSEVAEKFADVAGDFDESPVAGGAEPDDLPF